MLKLVIVLLYFYFLDMLYIYQFHFIKTTKFKTLIHETQNPGEKSFKKLFHFHKVNRIRNLYPEPGMPTPVKNAIFPKLDIEQPLAGLLIIKRLLFQKFPAVTQERPDNLSFLTHTVQYRPLKDQTAS